MKLFSCKVAVPSTCNTKDTKNITQNVIHKFGSLFGKEFKHIKTPMSEGYHPEIDDTPISTEKDSNRV
jgi:hypothetical protein